MRITKKQSLGISFILCLVAFIIPFCIYKQSDSLFTIISLSLNAVSTVAMIVTMVIAVLLYDRFGFEAKSKVKQLETVLELADNLKNVVIEVNANKFKYIIRPKVDFKGINIFKNDKEKVLLVKPNNFSKFLSNIYNIKNNDSLPDSIKHKIKLMEILAFTPLENSTNENYVRLFCQNFESNEVWNLTEPQMSFEVFNNNFQSLINEIESWLNNNGENYKF